MRSVDDAVLLKSKTGVLKTLETLSKQYQLEENFKKMNTRFRGFAKDTMTVRSGTLENRYPALSLNMCGEETCKTSIFEVTNHMNGEAVLKKLPTLVLIGGFGGRDTLGMNVLMRLVELLPKVYTNEKEWYRILNNVRLLVIPVVNMQGFHDKREGERVSNMKKVVEIEPGFDFNLKPEGYCYQGFVSQMLNQLHRDYLIVGGLVLSEGRSAVMYPDVQRLLLGHKMSPDKKAFEMVADRLKSRSLLYILDVLVNLSDLGVDLWWFEYVIIISEIVLYR